MFHRQPAGAQNPARGASTPRNAAGRASIRLSVVFLWLCHHYRVPFHPLWVSVPTWLLGTLATGIYYGRLRRV